MILGKISLITVFVMAENLLHICAAETIYCDGTFYTTPPMFNQIFIIHAFVGDVMFPLAFSLLPKRETHYYIQQILHTTQGYCQQTQPQLLSQNS